jgi:peptidoglycan hydrolase-like protein with peptidoglycan-binding domain
MEEPKRTWRSGLGQSGGSWRAQAVDDAMDDSRFGAFQQAWRNGASDADLFGDKPFDLKGAVGAGNSVNRRADVAKVETFLGRTGHYKPLKDGPSGYVSNSLDEAIRGFQADNGLDADGILNPGGPTIAALKKIVAGRPSPAVKIVNFTDNADDASTFGEDEEHDPDPGIRRPTGPDPDPGFTYKAGPSTAIPMPKPPFGGIREARFDGRSLLGLGMDGGDEKAGAGAPEDERGRPGVAGGASPASKGDALPTLEDSFLIDEWRDERRSSPPTDLTPDQRRTWETLDRLRNLGRNRLGHEASPDLLDHYLGGSGEPKEVDADWARQYGPIQEGEARSQKHFEDWLTGTGKAREDDTFGTIDDWLASGKSTLDIKGLKWDGGGTSASSYILSDQGLSLGSGSVRGIGNLHLERHGDEVVITGTVEQQVKDKYDFQKGNGDSKNLGMAGWLPQGIPAGDLTLDRARIEDLEKAGGAKAFDITSKPWSKQLTGHLKLGDDGKVMGSEFHWEEVPR